MWWGFKDPRGGTWQLCTRLAKDAIEDVLEYIDLFKSRQDEGEEG